MQFKETEIQEYIWNHRDELFSMIQKPVFEKDPNKKPWEYEPFELLYYQILKEYEGYYESLARLEFFGCEVRLPKDGESTIRSESSTSKVIRAGEQTIQPYGWIV